MTRPGMAAAMLALCLTASCTTSDATAPPAAAPPTASPAAPETAAVSLPDVRRTAATDYVQAVGNAVLGRLGVGAPPQLRMQVCDDGTHQATGFWVLPLNLTVIARSPDVKKAAFDRIYRAYRHWGYTIVHYDADLPALSVHIPASDTAVVLDGGTRYTANLMVRSGCRYGKDGQPLG